MSLQLDTGPIELSAVRIQGTKEPEKRIAMREELIDLKADTRCEAGLIGIALDPNFDQNHWIYLQHTVPVEGDKAHYEHHLGRFVFKDGKIDLRIDGMDRPRLSGNKPPLLTAE